MIHYRLGRRAAAIADHVRALDLDANDANAHNILAWVLATAREDDLRDGRRALEHAEAACELTDWTEPVFLDTLAAAYAECGLFDEAVEWLQQALPMFKGQRGEYEARLELYKANKPYREMDER